VKRKQLDLSQDPSASTIAKKVPLYKTLAAQESDAKRVKETLRAPNCWRWPGTMK
jgi:hypothetical protein